MQPSVVFGIGLFVLYFVVVPGLTFLRQEAKHRHRWRRRWRSATASF